MNTDAGFTRWLAVAALSVAGGCSPQARVTIQQPYLSGAQRELRMSSRWAFFAMEPEVRVLLSFPLPGAQQGDPFYDLYIHCPAPNGHYMLSDGDHHELDGFFRQARGRHAGTAPFEHATLRINGNRERCSGHLTARCRDGTTIRGEFFAELNPRRLAEFEARHLPADPE